MTPAMVWNVLALAIALVSLILALVDREIGSPTYLILFAIWVTMYVKATSPW